MSEIQANIRNLANELKKDHEFNKDRNLVTFQDADKKITAALPDGLTMDNVKSAQGFLIDVTAAHTLALGEVGQANTKKGGDLGQRITAKTKVGYSTVESSWTGKKEGVSLGKEWTKYGTAKADFTIGTGRQSTNYKDVVKSLAAQAEKAYS